MSLYSFRTNAAEPGTYTCVKLDSDLNPEATYLVSHTTCSCPAGARSTCRHRTMLPRFLLRKHVDTGWFYDYETSGWHKPLENAND